LNLIRLSLPSCINQWRLDLLPLILTEWGRAEVIEHWRQKPEPACVRRSRWVRGHAVEIGAGRLAEALGKLDEQDLQAIIFYLASPLDRYPQGLTTHNIEEAQRKLAAARELLPQLARATREACLPFVPRQGPARNDVPYLVLLDLTAIFEWLTSRKTPRGRFKRDPDEEQLPFHKFLEALWPLVFESDHGLSNAVKIWNSHRKKYGDRSPLIANLALRHPEWGIFR
jgi:hypothetical protein